MDKGIIRSNLSDITSSTVNPEKVEWANTGGSTGEPLRFPRLVSKIPFEDIHQLYLYKQMGWNYGDIIISIDGSRIAENELAKRHYWKEGKNFPYGRYSLSTMYMSNETLPYYIDFIQVVKPCVLRGYPSGLKMLCTYIKENSIKLNFRPKGIYLTSEYASEEDRTFISNVLCCDVWGQYGHTEVSAFAISKPGDERYLCSPFYGITEILDESDQHAHKECHQFIIAASGAFEIVLDDGTNKRTVTLNRPFWGLHIPPGIWASEQGFSSGSICLVLASNGYSEEDYIRNYDNYMKYVEEKRNAK